MNYVVWAAFVLINMYPLIVLERIFCELVGYPVGLVNPPKSCFKI